MKPKFLQKLLANLRGGLPLVYRQVRKSQEIVRVRSGRVEGNSALEFADRSWHVVRISVCPAEKNVQRTVIAGGRYHALKCFSGFWFFGGVVGREIADAKRIERLNVGIFAS